MTSMYDTAAGTVPDPITVELWTHQGQRLGLLQGESMTFTFSSSGPDVAQLELPLDFLTSTLVPCDGTVLVGMRINGKTHLTMPVDTRVSSGEDPTVAVLKCTTAGGRSLLDGQRVPPSLEAPITEQVTEQYMVSGPLETVVKRLVSLGQERTGHPLHVLPDQGRGPYMVASGSWDTVGEKVTELLASTGYRLVMDGWLPGDPQPEGATLSAPSVLVDVVPFKQTAGVVWSVDGGDITDWQVGHKRATTTRTVVGYETDNGAERRYMALQGVESFSPWSVREGYTEYTHPDDGEQDSPPDIYRVLEGMEAHGRTELAKAAPVMSMDVSVELGGMWKFDSDSGPRSFDLGDTVEVHLPYLGGFTQVITEVEVAITPETFTVSPTVSTPDTLDTDPYSVLADMTRRVQKLERT